MRPDQIALALRGISTAVARHEADTLHLSLAFGPDSLEIVANEHGGAAFRATLPAAKAERASAAAAELLNEMVRQRDAE